MNLSNLRLLFNCLRCQAKSVINKFATGEKERGEKRQGFALLRSGARGGSAVVQWHREVQLLWAVRQINLCSVFGIQVSPLGTNPTDCAHGKEFLPKTPLLLQPPSTAPPSPSPCSSLELGRASRLGDFSALEPDFTIFPQPTASITLQRPSPIAQPHELGLEVTDQSQKQHSSLHLPHLP